MLNNYLSYLEYVNDKLSSFFDIKNPIYTAKKAVHCAVKMLSFPILRQKLII